jgi:hypothetical protein
MFFFNNGIKKIPPINQEKLEKISFNTENSNSVPENCWLTATVDSNTIIKIATISCTMSEPITIPANFVLLHPTRQRF